MQTIVESSTGRYNLKKKVKPLPEGVKTTVTISYTDFTGEGLDLYTFLLATRELLLTTRPD